MKTILAFILTLAFAMTLAIAQDAPNNDLQLTEVEQLKIQNLRLQKSNLQQHIQLLQDDFSSTQSSLRVVDDALQAEFEKAIKEHNLTGYIYDRKLQDIVKQAPPAKDKK
jgi:peptidoglycan hydrolase CwlO-like protein